MNERLKALVEIAGIELAYARAEVEVAKRLGEEKSRIAIHLAAVGDALELIMSAVEAVPPVIVRLVGVGTGSRFVFCAQ